MFRKTLLALTLMVSGLCHAQVPISGLPPANLPLQPTDKVIVDQVISGQKSTRQAQVQNFTSLVPPISAAYILQAPNVLIANSRTLTGSSNQVILTDGGPGGNLTLTLPQPIGTLNTPTFGGLTLTGGFSGTTGAFSGTLSSSGYTGTTGSFTGALSALSLSLTNPLPAISGGTGFASYAVGDLLTASTTTALSRLSDVAVGSYLRSGGVNTLSLWSTLTLPNAATTGDLLAASGTNAIGNIVDVAAGSYLRSAGAGVLPAYSTLTLPNAATTGDLFIATGTNAMGNLSDVAVGSYLRSGGVTTAPLYSTVKIPNTDALGDLWVSSSTNNMTALGGNTTTTRNFLTQTGNGSISASPAWGTIAAGDLPGSFSGFANPSGLIGLTAVNGVATTADRSDSTHALDQTIAPTWTAKHLFTNLWVNGGLSFPITIASGSPTLNFSETDQTAGRKNWNISVNNQSLQVFTLDDTGTFEKSFLSLQAGASGSVTSIAVGNATDSAPITLNGPVTVPTPASGNALVLNGVANSSTETIAGSATTGQSFGLTINAGTNASDYSLSATTQNGASILFKVFGNGAITMPFIPQTSAAQTGTVCWQSGGISVDTTTTCLLSARRYKQDIEGLDIGLSEVMKLRPISYALRPEVNPTHLGRQVGFIAEEIGAVDDRLMGKTPNGQAQGVRYQQLTAVLAHAIQQQQYEIRALWASLIGSFVFTYFRTRRRA